MHPPIEVAEVDVGVRHHPRPVTVLDAPAMIAIRHDANAR
jgi:hypothetical protein